MGSGRPQEVVAHEGSTVLIDLHFMVNISCTSAGQIQFFKYLYSSTMTPGTGVLLISSDLNMHLQDIRYYYSGQIQGRLDG